MIINIRVIVARLVLAALIYQIVAPVAAYALTSGQVQAEFASFGSDANMVDPFTGQFSYSIPVLTVPGPNGSDYSMSLDYHSGSSSEDEASWVGKGWNLSPGSIVRNRRALPDDYKNAQITQVDRGQENWTVTTTKKLNAQIFSEDLGDNISGGALVSTQYNNHTGFHHLFDASLSAGGYADVEYSVNDGEATFKPTISPGRLFAEAGRQATKDVRQSLLNKGVNVDLKYLSVGRQPEFLCFPMSDAKYNVNFPEYEAGGFHGAVQVSGDVFGLLGVTGSVAGNYVNQTSKDKNLPAYGYMYTADAASNPGAQTDYFVEKESQFSASDRYLGIPFSGADVYSVFGDGISGVFRLHHARIGQFHPPQREVTYETFETGSEVHIAGALGLGASAAVDHHDLDIGGWEGDGTDNYKFRKDGDDEPVFFRYAGDLAGSVEFQNSDRPVRSSLPADIPLLDLLTNFKYNFSQLGMSQRMMASGRAGRSTYVGYNTNAEMLERPTVECYGAAGPSYSRSYNKADSSRRFVDRADDNAIKEGVGEFAITDPNGRHCVFGLPVYSRNEHELSFMLDGASSTDGLVAYKSVSINDPGQHVVGQIRATPYATTYLLTQMTTPDYIDRTHDGPSADDYGGYTKFNYKRTAGSNTKSGAMGTDGWYKWRMPYRGLMYNRNSFSDPNDDMGSVTYGEKEIYFLSSVETKTHIAFFRTSPREDGFEAEQDEANASGNPTGTLPGQNKMERLDSICLYTKNSDGSLGQLMQTVHFDYGYELWPGTPNSKQSDANPNRGSLTLKRVYFESEGAVNARVSPYVFGYSYRQQADYDASVSSLYDGITTFAKHFNAGAEAPAYAPSSIDRWGFYRQNGLSRSQLYNPWVEQSPAVDDFDPAAWQLKWIQLPSGGEIQAQYEQNQYQFVQDQRADAMVRLKDVDGGNPVVTGRVPAVLLNLADLGIEPGNTGAVDSIVTMLNKTYTVAHAPRMYFKFLYALQGITPNLTNCSSEYINGYLRVKSVEAVNSHHDVKITFADNVNGGAVEHPQDLARRMYATRRAGIVDEHGICDPTVHELRKRPDDTGGDIFFTLLALFGNTFYTEATTAQTVRLDLSYLRIPMLRPKKGGGLRVKRVLTYDRGLETGTAMLYGTEYSYTNADGSCSGVATNEPGAGSEENSLVDYLQKREPQSGLQKMVGGTDLDLFEGPLGESLLPGPSIGYRRLVAQNIHTGLTGTGYSVYEYFTAYDYPFNKRYVVRAGEAYPHPVATDIDGSDQYLEFGNPLGRVVIDRAFNSQGYSFVTNSMHGQPRRIGAYGGSPDHDKRGEALSETIYEYFEPGQGVPLRTKVGSLQNLSGYLGREQEVTMENREVRDVTVRGGGKADFVLSSAIFAFAGAATSVGYEEHCIDLQTISKVVRYPAIIKSVTTIKDGMESRAENVGFDPESGRPIVQRTTDGYDNLSLGSSSGTHSGAYYAYSIPAAWNYPALGQVAQSEGRVIAAGNGVTIEKWYTSGHFLNFSFSSASAISSSIGMLTPGDLIVVLGRSRPGDAVAGADLGTFYVGAIAGNQVELLPTYISNNNTVAMTLVDTVKVIHTGRTNQLNWDSGSIQTYGSEMTISPVPLQ